MSSKIHAPYHFVPLSKWVYMPDWAHLVSHDVPFKDGLSGIIEYTVNNQTPLCVGSEQTKQDDGSSVVKFARDPLKNLVIPSSTMKGMLRSVLEIVGFGKFNQLDDRRFSFRDISDARCNYLSNIIKPYPPKAGWLKFDVARQQWSFTPCQYAKIKHADLKKAFDIEIKNDLPAVKKYQRFPLSFSFQANISQPKGKQNNCWVEQLGKGSTQGHVIFTNKRIISTGKPSDYEFSYFFYSPEPRKVKWQIDQQVQDFFDNHNLEQIEYLKKNPQHELGIPVFALIKGEKIHSIGLAKMPRVSYKNSTKELTEVQNKAHFSDLYFDLAELIFGTLREEGLGLKSRVSFSDAYCTSGSEHMLYSSNLVVLNEPKPTFYPAYIEQDHDNHRAQYNDYDHSQPLSGHKRYIVKRPADRQLESNVVGTNRRVAGSMELCPVGQEFRGKIVFHNLKPVELGAILWCMQLEQGSYHQMGHGKPMGAGVVTVSPTLSVVRSNERDFDGNVDKLVELFVTHMEAKHPNGQWRLSPQLENMLAIGRMDDNAEVNTRYMDINKREFQTAKKEFAKLDLFNGLARKEPTSFNPEKCPSEAFASGRLAALFEPTELWQKTIFDAKETRLRTLREEQSAQEERRLKEVKLAGMTEHQRYFVELKEKVSQANPTDRAPLLRDALSHLIGLADSTESDVARELYQLARSYELHKSPKKRVDEHKQLLAKLLDVYEIKQ
ncbi:TPA: TIGR03986 family CRISPR-associated RAMP protein [Vibrio vulnificus]